MSNKSCKYQKSYFSMVFTDDNASDTDQNSKLDLDHKDSSNKPSNKSLCVCVPSNVPVVTILYLALTHPDKIVVSDLALN